MAAKRSWTPFLWTLFSAGGTVAALLLPVHVALVAFALPLGWVDGPGDDALRALVRSPLVSLYLLVLCSLPLFHAAHRFRYTLYDGLQIKHLNEVITVLCYGGATAGTAAAAVLLWSFH